MDSQRGVLRKCFGDGDFGAYLKSLAVFFLGITISVSSVFANTYFYDGERRIELQEEADLIAEKSPASLQASPNASLVRRVDRNSRLVKNQGGILVWKTNPLAVRSGIQKNFQVRDVDTRYLPVFRSQQGGILVPTGNTIVYFREGLSEPEVRKWAASRGLQLLEKLPLSSKNAWVIQTPPGRESIRIANSLVESGEVLSATPNFWIEFAKK